MPQQRTVVLRCADRAAGELWCYTDRRSHKAVNYRPNQVFSWLFWGSSTQLQVRASGPTRWLERGAAEKIFGDLPKHQRKAYATEQAPGSKLLKFGSGLPDDWNELSLAETDYAREHFGVMITSLRQIELLELGRGGNRRLLAQRSNPNSDWQYDWVVP